MDWITSPEKTDGKLEIVPFPITVYFSLKWKYVMHSILEFCGLISWHQLFCFLFFCRLSSVSELC